MTRRWACCTRSSLLFAGWIALLALTIGACSSKTTQYPADHERIRRIDHAVDALRNAYQEKNGAGFRSMMLQGDQLDQLQRLVETDFESFHSISLDFIIERVMIQGDDIDVYVRWQGVWKKQADDTGMRQRGHARLQWIGTDSILLRGVQGDLPFGMKARQALSEPPPSRPATR